ncbi:MAG: helix-turn-helix transcriptional regulator [Actinomycetota bacterium]|nr:helix-turn-helix transcriptional regulator [Actinomycetota bacterium]
MPREDFDAQEPMKCELSPRELQILRMAACGMGNKEVANTLHLSNTIIERNLSNVYGKLDVGQQRRGREQSRLGGLGLLLEHHQGRVAPPLCGTAPLASRLATSEDWRK